MIQVFLEISDVFKFGRYRGLSLSDVLDLNPDYIKWCMYNVSFPFWLSEKVLQEIERVYPSFLITQQFACRRMIVKSGTNENNNAEMDEVVFNSEFDGDIECVARKRGDEKYVGTYVQDVMGWSDEEIDDVLDGEPDAYWNID